MGSNPASSAFGVVNIRAEHDVASELALSPPKCKMLEFIAAHGGEVPFSWDSFAQRKLSASNLAEAQAVDDSRDALVDLINDSYVREREYVNAGSIRLFLRLTDKGRSVVAELEKFRLVPESVKPISNGEIKELLK
jgi:hypothetical protein